MRQQHLLIGVIILQFRQKPWRFGDVFAYDNDDGGGGGGDDAYHRNSAYNAGTNLFHEWHHTHNSNLQHEPM